MELKEKLGDAGVYILMPRRSARLKFIEITPFAGSSIINFPYMNGRFEGPVMKAKGERRNKGCIQSCYQKAVWKEPKRNGWITSTFKPRMGVRWFIY